VAVDRKAGARERLLFLRWAFDSWEDALEGTDEEKARQAVERVERQWLALHGAEVPEAMHRRVLARIFVQTRRTAKKGAGEQWDGVAFMRQMVAIVDPGALDAVDDSTIAGALTSRTIAAGLLSLWKAAGVPGSEAMVDKYTRGIDADEDD